MDYKGEAHSGELTKSNMMIGGDKTALKRQLTLSAQGENFEVHAVEK